MTILTARTRETIRAALLARLGARFAAGLAPLDVREPGDAWQMTDALAVLLSALEGQAAGGVFQILPDRATGAWLDAHGDVPDLPRQDGESDADYQTRVLAWWDYRLPTGSPADLVAACETTEDCYEAYAYPYGLATKGVALVFVLGPPQGQSASDTRTLTAGQITAIRGYLDGTLDIHGDALVDGEQRRIVTGQTGTSTVTPNGNVVLQVPAMAPEDVTLAITSAPTHPWPWTGSHAITASTATSWTVTGRYDDDPTAAENLLIQPWLIPVATTVARGGFVRVTPESATYNGGGNFTKFGVSVGVLPGVPLTTTGYPAPPNWETVRNAIFDVFDALTPADNPSPVRYPALTSARPSKLYLGGLYLAVTGSDGVTNATITAPAATVTPTAQQLITLGRLTITRIP